MNRVLAAVALLASAFLTFSRIHAEGAKPSPSPVAAARSVPSLRPSYDSFRLVHTRNVFDPDRRPVRPPNGAPAPTTRADYAALTGTMLLPDKTYAFFSGSRSEFNRVLTVREKIANATITGITALNIEVERDGKRTTVAIGQTVPFDNQTAPGVPPVEAPPDTPAPSAGSGAPATATAAGTLPPTALRPTAGTVSTASKGPPANLEEIRRRMMEKRQQELK